MVFGCGYFAKMVRAALIIAGKLLIKLFHFVNDALRLVRSRCAIEINKRPIRNPLSQTRKVLAHFLYIKWHGYSHSAPTTDWRTARATIDCRLLRTEGSLMAKKISLNKLLMSKDWASGNVRPREHR